MNIQEIREEFKMSRAEFADIVGVSVQTIHNWENGSKIPDSKKSNLNKIFENVREKLGINDKKYNLESNIKVISEPIEINELTIFKEYFKLQMEYKELMQKSANTEDEIYRLRGILDKHGIKY